MLGSPSDDGTEAFPSIVPSSTEGLVADSLLSRGPGHGLAPSKSRVSVERTGNKTRGVEAEPPLSDRELFSYRLCLSFPSHPRERESPVRGFLINRPNAIVEVGYLALVA